MSRHLRRHFVDGEPPFRWIQNSRPSDGPSTSFSVASCGITYSASGLLDLLVAHGLGGGCRRRENEKSERRNGGSSPAPLPIRKKAPFSFVSSFLTRFLPVSFRLPFTYVESVPILHPLTFSSSLCLNKSSFLFFFFPSRLFPSLLSPLLFSSLSQERD